MGVHRTCRRANGIELTATHELWLLFASCPVLFLGRGCARGARSGSLARAASRRTCARAGCASRSGHAFAFTFAVACSEGERTGERAQHVHGRGCSEAEGGWVGGGVLLACRRFINPYTEKANNGHGNNNNNSTNKTSKPALFLSLRCGPRPRSTPKTNPSSLPARGGGIATVLLPHRAHQRARSG